MKQSTFTSIFSQKPIPKLFYLIALSLTLSVVQTHGQIIFSEDFEADIDTNSWQIDSSWLFGTTGMLSSSYFFIPEHTRFAAVNDDALGADVPSVGRIISPEIDLTGIDMAILRFEAYFINGDYGGDETAKVLVSVDGMATWQELLDLGGGNEWESHILLLPFSEKIHIAFEYNDGNGWNYGFCVDDISIEHAPDYLAEMSMRYESEYTRSTPRQLAGPLPFVFELYNYGSELLEGTTLDYEIFHTIEGTVLEGSHTIAPVSSGASVLDTFEFMPTVLGRYFFQFRASHPELGDDFFVQTATPFDLDETSMARDDNEYDNAYGFAYGDPEWYGYYGSGFDLVQPDTLLGIAVYTFTTTAGSFNLTVNQIDTSGLPNIELFHSDPIEVEAGVSYWYEYPLPDALPLAAGNYVFAVGQDTVQGVMGHGFDEDRINPDYWIVSPIAGGGYPWENYPSGFTLMVRPILKEHPIINATSEAAPSQVSIYPNPTTGFVQIEMDGHQPGEPMHLMLTNASGQVVLSEKTRDQQLDISSLPTGIYFLKIKTKHGMRVGKLMKQ